MTYTVLLAVLHGIIANIPLMAVKAFHVTDAQLQLPQSVASLGFFVAAFMGVAMARKHKKPFVWVPGILGTASLMIMAWAGSPIWFIGIYGIVLIFDFAIRPANTSIMRSVYPDNCRSHVSGTLQQYANIVMLASSLLSAYILQLAGKDVFLAIRLELVAAAISGFIGFICFAQLPNHGDGSPEEAEPERALEGRRKIISFAALADRSFRRFVALVFFFTLTDLFFQGIVTPFFMHDLGFGYVESTFYIQIVPALAAFLIGGHFTSWFDRTTVWRSYGMVALLWGGDPVLLAITAAWPLIMIARVAGGVSAIGSRVLFEYTGVHAFAKPGPETSYYIGTLFFFAGFGRLIAPMLTALAAGYLTHRQILFIGGVGVMLSGILFLLNDRPRRAAL